MALARAKLADTGMTVAREDLALEAAFWAQLPGNFPMRPRKAPITSRNFCRDGRRFTTIRRAARRAITGVRRSRCSSRARARRFTSRFTPPIRRDPEGGSRKDTGHTLICGPTGSGQDGLHRVSRGDALRRQGATQVIFDKDRGLEILVRALGGEYCPLKNGEPTGFNPLKLSPTPLQHRVPEELAARACASCQWRAHGASAGGLGSGAARDAGAGALGAAAVAPARVPGRDGFRGSLRAAVALVRASVRGDYAWVFDNEEDLIVPRLAGNALVGFDVTDFLDHEVSRTPVTLYLFHLVRHLLDGRRLVCWMDEFWRLLADPAFESFAKDGPKTWRKLNGVMALATQSASDVLQSPISRTIIEQTPTKVFFPNADANARGLPGGLRADRAGVPADQGGARAGLAAFPR